MHNERGTIENTGRILTYNGHKDESLAKLLAPVPPEVEQLHVTSVEGGGYRISWIEVDRGEFSAA